MVWQTNVITRSTQQVTVTLCRVSFGGYPCPCLPVDNRHAVLLPVAASDTEVNKTGRLTDDPSLAGRAPELPAVGGIERFHNGGGVDGRVTVGACSHRAFG